MRKVYSQGLLILTLMFSLWSLQAVANQQAPAGAKSPAPTQSEETETTPAWKVKYEKALANVSNTDAEGHYQLAVDLVEGYKPDDGDIEPLEKAQEHLKRALEIKPDHSNAKLLIKFVGKEIKAEKSRLNPDITKMAFLVLGGLGIFLLGMKFLSEGMQAIAGNRLRKMINAVTDRSLMGVGTGTIVTCIVQSSSITTVIVVGFVNGGLMLLHQAVGVIMGANIGTTITGWILVLDIGKWGLPIIGIFAFIHLFAKRDRIRYLALALLGLGMVFYGLELMKNGFKPVREVPEFSAAFAWFRAITETGEINMIGVFKCVLVGSILTAIVQSSSATLGVTIAIAAEGNIDFATATALVLGQNIGTTITAWLASIGTTTIAKRAAWFHIFFNTLGVLIIIPLFAIYIIMISKTVHFIKGVDPRTLEFGVSEDFAVNMTFAIASAHTVFNVVMTVLNLPFVRNWARLLERIFPDKKFKETGHLTRLDVRMVESPVIGIEQSHGEIVKMGRDVDHMMKLTREALSQQIPDESLVNQIFEYEQRLDTVQHEVIDFLTDLLTASAPHQVTDEGREQLRVADEYESISDYAATILKAYLRISKANLAFTDEEKDNLLNLHQMGAEHLNLVSEGFENMQDDIIPRARTLGDAITRRVKQLRDNHVSRQVEQKVDPVMSMSYLTILNGYRKIKDHAINIAEALVHEED